MPHVDVPTLGNLLLCAILVAAGYTFTVSVGAARGRPQLTPAARQGIFATVALVAGSVLLLAYAFQSHDFRIRYVAALQRPLDEPALSLDGALGRPRRLAALVALPALALHGAAFRVAATPLPRAAALRHRDADEHLAFFGILMLFAANPFATSIATGAPPTERASTRSSQLLLDGDPPAEPLHGLHGLGGPLRLRHRRARHGPARRRVDPRARASGCCFAWLFLSIGNCLGMLWAYEELGWGGYWAWDPVENASFMPWLTASAYLHSIMIQERRGTLKVWNVFAHLRDLLAHDLRHVPHALGPHRQRPQLRAAPNRHLLRTRPAGIESPLSREFAFLLNNWILLGC
jgi:cytochrome c-type biogenesis protein CcmF